MFNSSMVQVSFELASGTLYSSLISTEGLRKIYMKSVFFKKIQGMRLQTNYTTSKSRPGNRNVNLEFHQDCKYFKIGTCQG